MSPDDRRPDELDYLWDRSGPIDPEIAGLEARLAPLRHRSKLSFSPAVPARGLRPRRILRLAAGLGALLLGAAALWRLSGSGGAWTLAAIDGAPAIDGAGASPGARLSAGQRLSTDRASRVRLLLPRVGEVEIGPGSRVRVLADRRDAQALALEQGTLRARTWAPPKLFSIDTPAGRAVDYGCAYTVDVDGAGTTRLRVEMGWVALEIAGREALVPAGAALRAGRGEPIGTPVWLVAKGPLRAAVETLDRTADPAARALALDAVLAAAGPDDGLTLWHLIANGSDDERRTIFDRLAAIAPLPASIARDAVLRGDHDALRGWFSALGLGDVPGWD